MGKRTFRIFSILALVIMICYQAAIIRYTHIHIVNGIVITHFHWFDQSKAQPHEHTASELARIDVLFHFIHTVLPSAMSFLFLIFLIRNIDVRVVLPFEYTELIPASLRGPPVDCPVSW